MSDTYIPSGEESAQEQQFLQALVGQIQSQDAGAVPKFASEFYCNFGGRYDTLAVNTTMLNATVGTSYPGLTTYQGFFIVPGLTGSTVPGVPPSNTLGGLTASGFLNNGTTVKGYFFTPQPNYQPGVLNWGWDNYPAGPSTIISQPRPGFPAPPIPGGVFSNFAFYRQSFLPCPFYIFMPKWMVSFTVGMRLYDNLGVLQPILIASKTNAKWQSANINVATAPDGSYQIESLSPSQFKDVPRSAFYITGTVIGGFGGLSTQYETLSKYFIVNSFNENPSGGQSVITISLSNYQNIGVQPAYNFLGAVYAIEYWTTASAYDRFGSIVLPYKYPTPSVPDVSNYPAPNQSYQFSLPAPPSLPYTYYFGFRTANPLNIPGTNFPWLSTFAVTYPATYPTDPAIFTVEPASFDIAKVTIANYSAVNPQPTGFTTPSVGVPTFNSLTLATMPLIGVDITTPL